MNGSLLRNPVAGAIAALLLVIVAAASFAIVPETRQAVILRFEQPLPGVYNGWRPGQTFGNSGAGLIVRIPFADRIVWVDKRVLDVDSENQQVVSSDQLRLQVDAYARYRVVDPLRMVVTTRNEGALKEALQPLLGNAVRNELGRQTFATLLTPERDRVMDNIQRRLQRTAGQYGVQIVDVKIKHADLPTGSPLDRALNQMRTARELQAATIVAQAGRQAQLIQADADARAAKTYADAFNKDPEFYNFYRAMQSYRRTFGDGSNKPEGSTSVILAPSNGYLREFEGGGR